MFTMFMSKRQRTSRILPGRLAYVALALICLSTPLQAQVIEEIVVTATKRAESAQDVPISLTAFSGESIQKLGFSQTYDIASQVPDLQFLAESAQSVPFIFLRGIGNTSFFTNSINPVGTYVDSVYIGQSIMQGFQLFDLERIEVLRGPQGTLFGRNTTGGLIHFITRKPSISDGYNAHATLTAGKFGKADVEAAAGIPLGKATAARIAVFYQTGNGMFKNLNPALANNKFGNIETFSSRGQVLWAPRENLDFLFKAHYSRDQSELTPLKPGYVISPFGVPNCPPGAISGALDNGCGDPFGFGLTVSPDRRAVQFSFEPHQDLESYGFSLRTNWEFSNYTITSITASNSADLTRIEDDDANLLVILSDTFLANTKAFSQELRLTSNYEGPTNWILGFFYYRDRNNSQLNFDNLDLGPPPGTGIEVPVGLGQALLQKTRSWAIFGDLTHSFWDRFTLRLGGRLTSDKRIVDIDTFFFNALLVPSLTPISRATARRATLFPLIPATSLEKDWLKWSGRGSLQYQIEDGQNIFVSASRGFKGGQFNGGALLDVSEASISNPEFVNSYEFGYKGTVLDRSLQLNATGFYMDLTNQQVLISGRTPFGLLPSLQNAASSTIKGVELELQWQPTGFWFARFGGAYLNAKFDKFFDPALGLDRSGNRLAHAPKWNLNGLVRYTHPVRTGAIGVQVDWNWVSSQFFTVENTPGLRENGYAVVNGRASYSFRDGGVELAFWIKNLFDKKYVVTGFDTASSGFGANVFVLSRPRTFGGQLILKYD